MPTEKGRYVLDTDALVVAISGILHQEQEWNGRTVLRPIAYGSKVLSDTEMKYGAPKAEMFAVVTFVEKFRAYLGSVPFMLRVTREVTGDDPEWAAAMASLTVSEKVKIVPSRRQHKENERDCRTIVQQIMSSIPQNVLTSTSYKRKEQGNDTQKKTVTFEDQDKEGEEVERNLGQNYLSGETNGEESRRVQFQNPGQESLSGESDVEEKFPDEEQDLGDKNFSGEFRWMSRTHRTDPEEGACSIADTSIDDNSRNSGIDTYSDRNSSSGSELSELAIHALLVETRARDLDKEVHQDPDSDCYLIPGERVFDKAADDLEKKRYRNVR